LGGWFVWGVELGGFGGWVGLGWLGVVILLRPGGWRSTMGTSNLKGSPSRRERLSQKRDRASRIPKKKGQTQKDTKRASA